MDFIWNDEYILAQVAVNGVPHGNARDVTMKLSAEFEIIITEDKICYFRDRCSLFMVTTMNMLTTGKTEAEKWKNKSWQLNTNTDNY